ncbi:MAG: SufD family Fe-S cluster assembly protein [Candidatus Moranbacteria bacterium]|nr:SufD family Fe-S cluster assembly protein [Candidatus Moranbacteria bacterium]
MNSEKEKLPPEFIKTAKMCGMEELLKSKGKFYVEKNKVLEKSFPEGVEAASQEMDQGVKAKITIKKGYKIKEPLFFCFGLSGEEETQQIYPEIVLEEGAEVRIYSHCTFPESKENRHEMEGFFQVGKGARLYYEEHHYHGKESGATVVPKLNVEVQEGGVFESEFNLVKGTVGKVDIQLEARLKKNAKSEISTKVFGQNARDDIKIEDKVYLEGENAKSLIKMRAAAKNGGAVLMQGETYAQAAGCQGHVDCQEIVVGKESTARAVPIVEVSHDDARVTHEASVGKVNQKELETLLTRGLSEEEATELIINALMK